MPVGAGGGSCELTTLKVAVVVTTTLAVVVTFCVMVCTPSARTWVSYGEAAAGEPPMKSYGVVVSLRVTGPDIVTSSSQNCTVFTDVAGDVKMLAAPETTGPLRLRPAPQSFPPLTVTW